MKSEKGQAFAEYIPTIAGFMALAFTVFSMWFTPLVEQWYQSVLDGFDYARQKELCNRGIGNGDEECDPGNSTNQGIGDGRDAGEDRLEAGCQLPYCYDLPAVPEGSFMVDGICEVNFDPDPNFCVYTFTPDGVTWSGCKNINTIEVWMCE